MTQEADQSHLAEAKQGIDRDKVIRAFTFEDNHQKGARKLSRTFAAHFRQELGGNLPDETGLKDLVFDNIPHGEVNRDLLDEYNLKISKAIEMGARGLGQIRQLNHQQYLRQRLWFGLGSAAYYFMGSAFESLPQSNQNQS